MSATTTSMPRRLALLAAGGPLLVLAVLLAVAGRYGYHRDELYFLACGAHPAAGYPDQPPLIPLLDHLVERLAPGSLTALRVPPALAAAAVPAVAGLTARELGASPAARVVAVWCTAAAGILWGAGHLAGTTVFDLLTWSMLVWLLCRVLRTRDSRLWLAFGLVAGVGLEVKSLVAVLLAALAVALAAERRWSLARDGWLWAGAAVALAMWAPNLWWQAAHGWPQLSMSAAISGRGGVGGHLAIPLMQLVLVSPVLVPVWVAGLRRLLGDPEMRLFRPVATTYLGLLALFTVVGGQPYYVCGLYPALLAAGAEPTLRWVRAGRRPLFVTAVVLALVASVVIPLPLLPVRAYAASGLGNLAYDVGEQVGWPRYVAELGAVWRGLPPGERDRAVFLTQNYGEAGALDRYGRGLPPAYSGHNGYGLWGPPPDRRDVAVTVGLDASAVRSWCARLRPAGRLDNGVGFDDDEQGEPVLVCSRLRAPWHVLWPRLRHVG